MRRPWDSQRCSKCVVSRALLLPLLSLVVLRDELRTLLLERVGVGGRQRHSAPLPNHAQATTTSQRGRSSALPLQPSRARRRLAEDTNGDGIADAFTFYTRTVAHACLPYTVAGASELTQSDLRLAVMDVFGVTETSRVELTNVSAGGADFCEGYVDLSISIYNERTVDSTAADVASRHVATMHQSPTDFLAALSARLPIGALAPASPVPTPAATLAPAAASAAATAAPTPAPTVDPASTMLLPVIGYEVTWPGDSAVGASGSSGGDSGGGHGIPWWVWLIYALVAALCLCPLLLLALRWRKEAELEEAEEAVGKKQRPQEGLSKIHGPQWGLTSLDFDSDPRFQGELGLDREYNDSHHHGRATESISPPTPAWAPPRSASAATSGTFVGGPPAPAAAGSGSSGGGGGDIEIGAMADGADAADAKALTGLGPRGFSFGGRGSLTRNNVTDAAWAGSSAHRRSSFPETNRMNFDASSGSEGGGYFEEFGWDGE